MKNLFLLILATTELWAATSELRVVTRVLPSGATYRVFVEYIPGVGVNEKFGLSEDGTLLNAERPETKQLLYDLYSKWPNPPVKVKRFLEKVDAERVKIQRAPAVLPGVQVVEDPGTHSAKVHVVPGAPRPGATATGLRTQSSGKCPTDLMTTTVTGKIQKTISPLYVGGQAVAERATMQTEFGSVILENRGGPQSEKKKFSDLIGKEMRLEGVFHFKPSQRAGECVPGGIEVRLDLPVKPLTDYCEEKCGDFLYEPKQCYSAGTEKQESVSAPVGKNTCDASRRLCLALRAKGIGDEWIARASFACSPSLYPGN